MNETHFELFFLPKSEQESTILGFCGSDILLLEDGSLPPQSLLLSLESPKHAYEFGIYHQECYSLHVWEKTLELPKPLIKANLRHFLGMHPPYLFAIMNRAKQLAHWLEDHQFCGRCATPTRYDAIMSTLKCPTCGHMVFPRLSPACIVLISKGDEILLARSYHFLKGMYSLVAGFIEAGETAEAAVHREVYEEVGIRIKNLRYFGSQPWPFPHSLMLGFFAEYESGEIRLQEAEIEDAKWFTKETLPQLPKLATISGMMINEWLTNR